MMKKVYQERARKKSTELQLYCTVLYESIASSTYSCKGLLREGGPVKRTVCSA